MAGLAGLLGSCTVAPPPPAPVTLTYQGISFGGGAERTVTARFTSETGIRVEYLPSPEAVHERLEQFHRAMEARSPTPDVYFIDVTWPGIVADHLLDLAPALSGETGRHFAAAVANDTVGGRLVAMPAYTDAGLLFYRTDLLEKYGYGAPPRTWDELEAMAARIQSGERAAGNDRFWGFAWQGADGESLTCNALEWQASHGGGRIVEPDGRVSVDNPATRRALRRAARWVGTISPPEVVGWREEDARGAWQEGNAAFMRNWPYAFLAGQESGSAIKGRYAVAPLPAGPGGRAHTLGGWQLAVSGHTRHPKEAVDFVRFMSGPTAQRIRLVHGLNLPTLTRLYDEPAMRRHQLPRDMLLEILTRQTVARPSAETGQAYPRVSAAYSRAVHSVLTGKAEAGPALAALQAELVRITGRGPERPGRAN